MARESDKLRGMSIDSRAHIGSVALKVSDLQRSEVFYRDVLGLKILRRNASSLDAGTEDDRVLLQLHEQPGAKPRPRRSTGLYHFAILTPSREALGRSFKHLMKSGYPLTGAADHLVSEALYLDDPDKNGIEIYRDRPKEEWQFDGESVRMANDEVDLDSLFRDAGHVPFCGLDSGTTMGHVHLHVRDLDEAEKFYCGILGFEVMLRWKPSAIFVSAGSYHHHIALNLWAGVGAPPPPDDAAGLMHYEIVFPIDSAIEVVIRCLENAGVALQESETGILVKDPSSNGILLKAAP
jgi:catechol 2,3-dioxygenase